MANYSDQTAAGLAQMVVKSGHPHQNDRTMQVLFWLCWLWNSDLWVYHWLIEIGHVKIKKSKGLVGSIWNNAFRIFHTHVAIPRSFVHIYLKGFGKVWYFLYVSVLAYWIILLPFYTHEDTPYPFCPLFPMEFCTYKDSCGLSWMQQRLRCQEEQRPLSELHSYESDHLSQIRRHNKPQHEVAGWKGNNKRCRIQAGKHGCFQK